MSRTVVDPAAWAGRAIDTVRDFVGRTERPASKDVARPRRWLVVTVYRQPDDVRTRVDGSGPLSRMRNEIELTIRPAPGDKGTELAARPTAPDGGSVDQRRRLRAALRETKSVLECGEVVEPSRPGSSHPGPAGQVLRAATARAWGEGRL
ncbi:hypothetical protein [Actinomycetospora lemnae]|uniref:Transposase n=1 Tax=Actinomycetospora lemnae TaxID=3019891 RepID=A0ABT5T0A3_9PSEU|nr:hypothetical protein [Actinomycetospora sp. DW7H6]MDD7968120.1 hypothetical protein [Actinomycetospora sp. DW7H6]